MVFRGVIIKVISKLVVVKWVKSCCIGEGLSWLGCGCVIDYSMVKFLLVEEKNSMMVIFIWILVVVENVGSFEFFIFIFDLFYIFFIVVDF